MVDGIKTQFLNVWQTLIKMFMGCLFCLVFFGLVSGKANIPDIY